MSLIATLCQIGDAFLGEQAPRSLDKLEMTHEVGRRMSSFRNGVAIAM
jgi:hypothetical protein